MKKYLDMEFGAAELVLDDELVQTAQLAGWAVYKESFNEDDTWCRRTRGRTGMPRTYASRTRTQGSTPMKEYTRLISSLSLTGPCV